MRRIKDWAQFVPILSFPYASCVVWSSSDLIFCFSANILKPSKVRSLKFLHQLQNYLGKAFLSSCLPFIIPLPLQK